jgi:two-component system CheB/CheR fusion protein
MSTMFSTPQPTTIPIASRQMPGNQQGSNHWGKKPEERPRILFVDDNPDVASLFALVLGQAGYRVLPVSSARAALDAAMQEHFDAIISDIGMPDMDGYELAKTLRTFPDYVATPMIAVTGFPEYAAHESAFNAGFNAHLKKPVEPAKLLEILTRLGQ